MKESILPDGMLSLDTNSRTHTVPKSCSNSPRWVVGQHSKRSMWTKHWSNSFVVDEHWRCNRTLTLVKTVGNRFTLQQQHVDWKIADVLLKKGTKHNADGWDAASKTWSYMVLHLPHASKTWDYMVQWFSTYLIRTTVLVWLLMILLRMTLFILLRHALCLGLVPFPRNDRVWIVVAQGWPQGLILMVSWSSHPLVIPQLFLGRDLSWEWFPLIDRCVYWHSNI